MDSSESDRASGRMATEWEWEGEGSNARTRSPHVSRCASPRAHNVVPGHVGAKSQAPTLGVPNQQEPGDMEFRPPVYVVGRLPDTIGPLAVSATRRPVASVYVTTAVASPGSARLDPKIASSQSP